MKVDKNFILSFAEHCMIKLVQTTPKDGNIPEISCENIMKIKTILNEFRK